MYEMVSIATDYSGISVCLSVSLVSKCLLSVVPAFTASQPFV